MVWKNITIERSQKLTSYQKLSDQTGLTIKQVRTAIEKLKASGEITAVRAHNGLLISIVNYDSYQLLESKKGQKDGIERASEGQVINKGKNENKVYIPENPLSDKLLRTLSLGGWDEIPFAAAELFELYEEDWIIEAFSKAVDKCGINPTVGYVKVILKNYKKGAANAGKKRTSRSTTKKAEGEGRAKRKSKFEGHPSGAKS